MAKIYLYKHQHAGVVNRVAFANPPTQKQLDAVHKYADGIWGEGDPLECEGQPCHTVEVDLITDESVPVL